MRPSNPLQTSLEAKDLPAAHGGYVGKSERFSDGQMRQNVSSLLQQGFEYMTWDGR